jgi:hypothetical protein
MKRIGLLMVIVALFVFNQQLRAQAKIEFQENSYAFGKIQENGGLATHKFIFKNTGDRPVIITNVESSCGCTTPQWTRKPVKPGESGFVSAQYDPRNRPGAFNKHILVYNTATKAPVKLVVTGEVIPKEKTLSDIYRFQMGPLRLKTNHVAFARIYDTDVKKQTIGIVNDSDKEIKLSFDSKRIPAHIKTEITPSVLKPKQEGKITITYDASKKNNWDYVYDRLNILVDGQSQPRNTLTISATIVEDFTKLSKEELANAPTMDFESREYNFGEIKQGDVITHVFKFKNNGKRDLLIHKTRSSCGCTTAEVPKIIKPGQTGEIKVIFNSAHKSGKQNKTVTLITNIPGKDKNGRDKYKIVLRMRGEVIVK